MRRQAWIEIIEKHTDPIQDDNNKKCSKRRVRGAKKRTEEGERREGDCFLQIFTNNPGNHGHDDPPICFPAHILDCESEDYLVYIIQEIWAGKETNSQSYIPWDQIMAIRYVKINKFKP